MSLNRRQTLQRFFNDTLEHLKERVRVESDPKQRATLEEGQQAFTVDLNRKRPMQASLQAQVDALRQQLNFEQSNLAELQRRLDDVDQSMTDLQK